MRASLRLIVLGVPAILAQAARGDAVELKNGTVVDGKYAGGTATTLRLETPQGVQVLQTSDVLALTFTAGAAPTTAPASPAAVPAAAAAAPTAAAAAAPAAPAGPVTVP